MSTQPKVIPSLDAVLVVQSILTLIFVVVTCYLWVIGRTPPDMLVNITAVLVGYFFGGRVPASAAKQTAAGIQALSEALR